MTRPTQTESRALSAGEKIQLTDPKGRMHTIVLAPGEVFHTHKGLIPHEDIIGRPEGIVVTNTGGVDFQVFRPLYEDFVLSMPRGAAVVYPKDAGLIVALGDVFPGATVVEAGVGSGALSIALLRAVGPHGRVHSFELREEFARIAGGNIADFFDGRPDNWDVTVGDLAETLGDTFDEHTVDRVVLDMLTPWTTLDAVGRALVPGGVVIAYVATVPQLSRFVEALRASGCYSEPQSMEAMVRGWHVDGLAVRPDHRMIAHTGFLVTARRMAPGETPLEKKRRPQGSPASADDVEAWTGPEVTEEAIGTRTATGKKLRRVMREAGRRLDRQFPTSKEDQ
ncbi:tRNA (adenine-58-N(1)-) methyltransferase [Brevibacterium sanguinis]|uniref:tRNA (adenine(58)-N(1))-methyltransferase TrmI n=2 Tax=Brevibacterium TaxID=1696 RepID=A0A366IL72_9MICO|nr:MULTISPECIES: tRNA (adenine-N1)-methyltransferase [Brevibacterium]RBP64692.1 tRNA (adenine-58-N(1)-) methyltransferase [Brevibacterium sanguinis]RBP71665.1 tRNA (adenine-58-N(1)-) methyltransferase [Brevibacterium celere]